MGYERILIRHDGSADADVALLEAARLAGASGAQLIMVACGAAEGDGCCNPGASAVLNEVVRQDAGERLRRSALLVADDCEPELVLLERDSPDTLAQAAAALGCDLVVIPAGPSGRIRRWLGRDPERALRRRGHEVRRAPSAHSVDRATVAAR